MRSIFASLAVLLTSFAACAQSFPPSPRVLVAVNPITNKAYVANEAANSVTVLDEAHGTTTTIPVGSRPQFIVVNPITNRIYVNNGGDASVTVIDGATDTNLTPTPLPVGSQGPMAVNTESNVVYIVRMTSLATDEVTFLNGNDNTWYTIATESFQPTALAVNPKTDTLYVAHYGTGDVRVISAADTGNAHPATVSIPAWSHPFAIAANTGTNKVYVITEDSRGPIGIIDGGTNTAQWPTPAAGHASGPKALAVNPVTNKIYAAFAGEVVVIDGGNGSLTYVPVNTGSGAASIAINYLNNKIYVSNDGGDLTVIDGFTNATTALTVPVGTISLGIDPITNAIIAAGGTTGIVDGVTAPATPPPVLTTINPLPSNQSGSSGTITMTASNGFDNPLPIRGVFYQLDATDGAWSAATGSGPYAATFSNLASGSHTIYAFAVEGHVASGDTGPQSNPLVGTIASYTFTVDPSAKSTPTVSVASSKNPSAVGESVTFTASVVASGGAPGTPTGSVTFKDGTATLCASIALASGSARCTTTALASGNHSITANYSGDSSFTAANASLTQSVNLQNPAVAITSSANPSTAGQAVTFTATVSGASGTPTGSVTFGDGGTNLCSAVTLVSGSATCTTSTLSAGVHTIIAMYSGNSTYKSGNAPVDQTVRAAGTDSLSITLGSTANPSTVGQYVTYTAVVSGPSGTPTGTIVFKDNGSVIDGCGGLAMTNGRASCTIGNQALGNHSMIAVYSGGGPYGGITSSTLPQVVNPAKPNTPSITLGSSVNPSTVGQYVELTAVVSGGAGTPTGTLVFLDNGDAISGCGGLTMTNGQATCTPGSLTQGTHSITAVYSGDSAYNGITSSTLPQTVDPAKANTPAFTMGTSANPSVAGQPVTFTAVLSGPAGTPTGNVVFRDNGQTIAGCGGLALVNGRVSCAPRLTAGSHAITGIYLGDANYNGITSGTVPQTAQ